MLPFLFISVQALTVDPPRRNAMRSASAENRIPGRKDTPSPAGGRRVACSPRSKTPRHHCKPRIHAPTLETTQKTRIPGLGLSSCFRGTGQQRQASEASSGGLLQNNNGEGNENNNMKRKRSDGINNGQNKKVKKDQTKVDQGLGEFMKREHEKAMILTKLQVVDGQYRCTVEGCWFKCKESNFFAAWGHVPKNCSVKKKRRRPVVVVRCTEQDCGLQFSSAKDHRTHWREAHPTPPEICPNCGKSFKLRQYLVAHMKREAHSQSKQPIQCPKCEKICSSENHLKQHIKFLHTISLEKMFKRIEKIEASGKISLPSWKKVMRSAAKLKDKVLGGMMVLHFLRCLYG